VTCLTSWITLDTLCYLYVRRERGVEGTLRIVSDPWIVSTFQAEPENYATGPGTVAYMPHCDLSLFERFLRDNWFPERLSDIILVGNNLSDYADKWVPSSLPPKRSTHMKQHTLLQVINSLSLCGDAG
jgi:hypothetical protein